VVLKWNRRAAALHLDWNRRGAVVVEERKSGAGLGSIFFVVSRILGQILTTYCI